MFRIGTFGFTMIETVVVIVVTGLLAGVSVPRLADAGQEARVSVLAATAGAAAMAMAVNHAGCQVTGQRPGTGQCVPIDDCRQVAELLSHGLSPGLSVAGAPIGDGSPASNGRVVDCVMVQAPGGATATFTGIAAGH